MQSLRYLRQRPLTVFMAVACVLFAGVAIVRYYYNPGTITTLDGKIVPDLSVSKAGPLSGDKFAPVRQTYLTSAHGEYSMMGFIPASTNVAESARRLKTLLTSSLLRDERDKACLAQLPADTLDDLCYRVALVWGRASGMSLTDYKARLTTDDVLVTPTHLLEEEDTLVHGLTPAAAFDKLYEAGGAGDYHVKSWALSTEGVRIAFKRLPLDQYGDVLLERFAADGKDYRIFRGDISKGSLVFHRSKDLEKLQSEQLMCCEIAMIVEDTGGDRYPLWLTLFFDPELKRWWLFNAYRMASPEATNRPRLAF